MRIGSLKERKTREREKEEGILRALADRRLAHASARMEKKHKRKSTAVLLAHLSVKPLWGHLLRDPDEYVPRSYSLERQLIGLINHMFVKYPIPRFMYQVCLLHGAEDAFWSQGKRVYPPVDLYRSWFIALAQGGSFPKLAKGIITSREAFVFLSGSPERKIHENIWWARMKVAGIAEGVCNKLIARIFSTHSFYDADGRFAEAIHFYARHCSELDRNSFDEVTDFIAHKLMYDRDFRMKGRTAASMVRLSNQWHHEQQRAKVASYIQWNGIDVRNWRWMAKNVVWVVTQLKDNRELVNEGRKQKHCVYSYVHRCVDGTSAIFSMRAYPKLASYSDPNGVPDKSLEIGRITIEVNSTRSIVQVRGACNRAPTEEELDILRRWIGETGLTMSARR